jgi:hypothetical protein
MFRLPVYTRVGAAALALSLAACSDSNPLATRPVPQDPGTSLATLTCTVEVRTGSLSCERARMQPGATQARQDKLFGGQGVYVQLASSGTVYDSGTEVLSSNVTVQNLLDHAVGLDSTSAVTGVKVFFLDDPSAVLGSGTVTVANPTSTDAFTASGQAYFLYNQSLAPMEISSALEWRFNVPSTVQTFKFTVAISAALFNEHGTILGQLDRVWTGAADSAWSNGANWADGIAPDSSTGATVPADSLLGSHRMPVLDANAVVLNLRVGYGSTLNLAGFTLTAWGNLDATGTVSGGEIWSRGSQALVGGNLGALGVAQGARVQRSTRTSGAVSVTGSLNVKDQALNISIP